MTATKTRSKKTSKTSKGKARTPRKPKIQTRLALVLDMSGSMHPYREQVIKLTNETLKTTAQNDPKAQVSLFYFDTRGGTQTIFSGLEAGSDIEFDSSKFQPDGGTPLFDAVGDAVKVVDPGRKKDAVMVMVLTDGEENSSHNLTATTFKNLILEKQATDRWTFAFLVPPGLKDSFVQRSGVHEGNVKEWEQSSAGFQAAIGATVAAVKTHYHNVASGQSCSRAVFTTDLSQVTKTDLKTLPDISKDVKIWTVDKETTIRDFVQSHGETFVPGRGYYALTKSEKVQEYKDVLVIEKGTKKVFAKARDLLGLPSSGTVRVVPGNHANWDIFILSTSVNRKLVRGTKFVYRVRV